MTVTEERPHILLDQERPNPLIEPSLVDSVGPDTAELEVSPAAVEVSSEDVQESEVAGYLSKLRDLGKRPLAKVMVGLAAFGGVTAAETIKPESAKAATSWTRLGGDPVVRGGVHSRNAFVRLITSSKGRTAMHYAGLDKTERAAAKKAARTGDFTSCHVKYGEHFKRMSFGINGTSVDRDVTFRDPRYRHHAAAAWCMRILVGGNGKSPREAIYLKVPEKCGNVALQKIVHLKTPSTPAKHPKPKTPTPQPTQQPTPASPNTVTPIVIVNNNENNNTNVNNNNNENQNTNVNNNENNNTNTTTTTTTTTPPPPPPPPPAQEYPPHITMLQKAPGFEPPFEGAVDQFCATGNTNPTTDPKEVVFDAKYGTVSDTYPDPTNTPDTYCAKVTEPMQVVIDQNVTATITDLRNHLSDSDSTGDFAVQQDSGF